MFAIICVGLVLLAAAWVIQQYRDRIPPKLDYPMVNTSPDKDLSAAMLEGYKKYPNTPFFLPTNPPRLFLPMSMHQEVIHAAPDKINFFKEVQETFQGRYTAVGGGHEEVGSAVRTELTKSMTAILPMIQDETGYAFDKELGLPADWTPIPLYPKLLRMVALLSGRVFVGLPLSREEEWVQASINFTTDVAAVGRAASKWGPALRPLVAPFLPEVRKAVRDLRAAKKWMEPLVAEILSGHDNEKTSVVKAGARGTFISWLMKHLPDNLKTAERVGTDQMLVSFASIHTTSMSGSMVLLDLASRPEYIQPLREEVEQVIREDGEDIDENGRPYIRKSSFAKMKKLDSFIKESQRCNPLAFSSGNRRIMQDYTFSNGITLPKGTRISFPMWAIYNSPETSLFTDACNAEVGNPGPEVFDGFRFSRLRSVPGHETKHQAVTTSPVSLNFGHGPHACPGRFFAIYEIKCLIVELIRHYDIRIMGDTEMKGGGDKRPKNMPIQMNNNPDFRAMLEIRKRRV